MYAVGFIMGRNPMGNDGLQKLHHKSQKGILQELQTMRKVVSEIFIMRDFTQKMCEMSNDELWAYCNKNYVSYIRGDKYVSKIEGGN